MALAASVLNNNQFVDIIKGIYRFIIDGIITLPIAFYGFLLFPDVPATTKAFYLSEEVCQDPSFPLNVLTSHKGAFTCQGTPEG